MVAPAIEQELTRSLADFASTTARRVVSASDTTQHGEALRDALDVARLFRRANDSGIGMTRPLLRSIEELVQATATAVPKLMAPELEAAVQATEGGEITEADAWNSAVRSRALTASIELHASLESAYRNFFDAEGER
jgi:hypothetical protein